MNYRAASRPLATLGLVLLPACSWDFNKLSVADFRKNLCDVADNYKKNAEDVAGRITDPARRDQAFADLNQKLGQLAQAKLRAYNAYVNCNEAELKAAQALAESIIGTLGDVLSANFSSPVRQLDFRMQGSKPSSPGPQPWQMTSGVLTMVAGTTPTGPVQVSGTMVVDLQSVGNDLRGPIVNLQWQVQVPGVATWQLRARPSTRNQVSLVRQATGQWLGNLHAALVVDGPGVTWPLVVDLPLTMNAGATQWACDSLGLRPAAPFLPAVPSAGVRFGHGCAGGLPHEPMLDSASACRVGDPLVVQVSDGPIGVSALIVGLSRTQLDLSPLFGVGCELFVTPDLTLFAPLPMGQALHTLPLPPEPSLAGLSLEMQALTLAPTASGWRAGMSGGLTETVQPR